MGRGFDILRAPELLLEFVDVFLVSLAGMDQSERAEQHDSHS